MESALEEVRSGSNPALTTRQKHTRPHGAAHGAWDDMLRLAASLERVPLAHKVEVGRWLLERLTHGGEKPGAWWALGRVGARAPLYGSAHQVVPPEVAGEWLAALLALDHVVQLFV